MNGSVRRPSGPAIQRWAVAVVAYVPLLLNDPGRVVADTKAYLYLDPGRLLERATSMWHPEVGMGTVTHQNIGFLWPIGPFYWLGEMLGLPDWLTQRLWMGSILMVAGLGMLWFLRTLGWRGPALLSAAWAYMLSPYILNFLSWVSPILLPWAALPWMLGLVVRSLRTDGWRYPAAFGLLTLTVGGVNATSLLFVGLGPVAWLVWSGLDRSHRWPVVLRTGLRIGVTVAGTSLWWVVGLWTQAGHGLPTLHLTENYRVVSDAATAPELFRGLGYWYFYGQGHLGPWIESAGSYTRWALPLSFGLPLLGLAVAAVVRFAHRGHALCLLVVGLLVGIGAHPYDAPSALGALFRDLTLTEAGLALRSTARVLPLVVLATAMFLGAGVAALGRWRPGWERPASAVVCLLAVANLSPLWQGELLGDLYQRDENVPEHWLAAADDLDRGGHDTRVLVVPGSDFGAYRWGHTGDPVLPGLMDRPHVARELIPQGSPASAELLAALDREFQEGRLDPDALAPMARLMGVGDVVVRSDLQFERYRTPRPIDLWAQLVDAPGFGAPRTFGEPVANVAGPQRPLLDEHTLSRPPQLLDPAPVAILPVLEPVPIVRVADPARPVVVDGDAAGVVAAAGEGLLEPGRPVLYGASLVAGGAGASDVLGPGARLVLTDTNRKEGRRWGTLRETTGFTERSDEVHDPGNLADQPLAALPVLPGSRTVARQEGIRVEASGYGNPVTYTPGDRPFHAVDGRVDTAWRVGGFSDVRGERITLHLDHPVHLDALTILQAGGADQNRWITEVVVTVDGRPHRVTLGPSSRREPGQRVPLEAAGPAASVVVEITDTDVGQRPHYAGLSAVGFAELAIDGIAARETIVLPTSLTTVSGQDRGAELVVLLSRQRVEPRDPQRHDPEVAMDRTVDVPWDRTFRLTGEARLSTRAHDGIWDRPGVTARATGSLEGDLGSRPRAAIDGDFQTAWQSPVGSAAGEVLVLDLGRSRPVDGLQVVFRSDGLHSVPTTVVVSGDDGPVGVVDLPGTLRTASGTTRVALDLPPFTSRTIALEFRAVAERMTMGWTTGLPQVLPVGVVEVEASPTLATAAGDYPGACRDDLLEVDGQAVPIRLTGTWAGAMDRQPSPIEPCGADLHLTAGTHRIIAASGNDTGIDLDRLVLTSPGPGSPARTLPEVTVVDQGRTSLSVQVGPASGAVWLVLGQSHDGGWQLRDERGVDLGPPRLVDGFANGWLIHPGDDRATTYDLRWAPQRFVRMGLGLTVLAALGCILLLVRGRRDPGGPTDGVPGFGPITARRVAMGPGGAALGGLLFTGFAVVNLPAWPLAAPVIGLILGLTLGGWLPARTAAGLGAVTMGTAATLIAVDQIRFRHPRDFVWPQFFEHLHVVGVVAILCLAAAAVEALLTDRSET